MSETFVTKNFSEKWSFKKMILQFNDLHESLIEILYEYLPSRWFFEKLKKVSLKVLKQVFKSSEKVANTSKKRTYKVDLSRELFG